MQLLKQQHQNSGGAEKYRNLPIPQWGMFLFPETLDRMRDAGFLLKLRQGKKIACVPLQSRMENPRFVLVWYINRDTSSEAIHNQCEPSKQAAAWQEWRGRSGVARHGSRSGQACTPMSSAFVGAAPYIHFFRTPSSCRKSAQDCFTGQPPGDAISVPAAPGVQDELGAKSKPQFFFRGGLGVGFCSSGGELWTGGCRPPIPNALMRKLRGSCDVVATIGLFWTNGVVKGAHAHGTIFSFMLGIRHVCLLNPLVTCFALRWGVWCVARPLDMVLTWRMDSPLLLDRGLCRWYVANFRNHFQTRCLCWMTLCPLKEPLYFKWWDGSWRWWNNLLLNMPTVSGSAGTLLDVTYGLRAASRMFQANTWTIRRKRFQSQIDRNLSAKPSPPVARFGVLDLQIHANPCKRIW